MTESSAEASTGAATDAPAAPHTAPTTDPSEHRLTCLACRVIDRADVIADGEVWTPSHYATPAARSLFDLMRRVQSQTADSITSFAGSMRFVYLHIAWFSAWIAINVGLGGFGRQFDKFPFGLLTMIVSLEAIFLSTFVMISQNRQAARSDLRNELDFENNIRSEVWAVHVGQALGLDVDHVEDVVRRAVEGAHAAMREASMAQG
jgi:uncharacterized membrane protein